MIMIHTFAKGQTIVQKFFLKHEQFYHTFQKRYLLVQRSEIKLHLFKSLHTCTTIYLCLNIDTNSKQTRSLSHKQAKNIYVFMTKTYIGVTGGIPTPYSHPSQSTLSNTPAEACNIAGLLCSLKCKTQI